MVYILIVALSQEALQVKIDNCLESWHPAGYRTRVLDQGDWDSLPDTSNRNVFDAMMSGQIRTIPAYHYWAIVSRYDSCD